MRYFLNVFFTSMLMAVALNLSAQQNAELGVRITQAPYNKIQLEFRKPFNEQYALRLGASVGEDYLPSSDAIIDANDSTVTIRHKDGHDNYYDLRFGLNRILKASPFSIHGDFIFGYSRNYRRNWSYLIETDSLGNWNEYETISPMYFRTPVEGSGADAYNHFLAAGLSGGISFDYPLGERFVASLNLNQTFVMRFQFKHTEHNDLKDEFHDGNANHFEFYSTFGVGLRYKFGVKKEG